MSRRDSIEPTPPASPQPALHGLQTFRFVTFAAAVLLALAACGGGDSGNPFEEPPVTPPPVEPPPVEPPPVEPPPSAASACLNPALYTTPGTVAQAQYRLRVAGVDRMSTQTQTVEGPAVLDGRNATRLVVSERTQTSGQPDETFDGAYYLTLADEVVSMVGSTSEFEAGGQQVTQTIVLDPAQPDLDFSLAVGEKNTVTSTGTISFEPMFAPTDSSTLTATVTFVGFETVTVPAGTFTNACKFTYDLTTAFTRTSTRWVARGSGVVLRAESGDDTQELVAATIDGVAVTP